MRTTLSLHLMLIFLCLACSPSKEAVEPELSYDQKENVFLKDFRQKALGRWRIDKMTIAKNYIFSPPEEDSTASNVGYIDVNNIDNDANQKEKYNQLQASFTINSQSMPIKGRLFGYNKNGKQFIGASGLIESAYMFSEPVYIDELPSEYQFLDKYFFGDNYVIELDENAEHMTWKGLNHFVRAMELTKVN